MSKRCISLASMLLAGALLCAVIPTAAAHHLLPSHKLDCSKAFPCPKALHTRIDFWIEVFSKWDSGQVVFHDAEHPGRVFDVFHADGCGAQVDGRRKRLKNELLALAKKVEQGRPVKGRRERHLLNVFPRHKAVDIRASAGRLRCQQGVKDPFINGLKRYYRYRDMVVRILKEHDLPTDLQYLPFVESSYNPAAYSKAAATGLWQIMPATARGLGLELDATLDERLDPEAATIAAARYLQDARAKLKNTAREIKPDVTNPELYPFVVTSYNYGVNGMRRAVDQEGPNFMRVLQRYKSPAFQVAVKNFYASFLAARHVARNADKYFGKLEKESPLKYETVVLHQPASIQRIVKVFGVDETTLKSFNPALTRFVWNNWRQMPDGYRLRLPPSPEADGWQEQIARLRALPPEKEQIYKPTYVVKRDDTACSVAQAFRVQCKDLIAANQLGKKAKIKVGQKLQIPGRSLAEEPAKDKTGPAGAEPAVAARVELKYQVRKGDTACGIAERHKVPCRELIRFNKLGRKALVRRGQWLKIPGGGVKTAASTARDGEYKVRRGDTLCELAESFHLSCSTLMAANDLGRKGTIRVGQVLQIPVAESLERATHAGDEQVAMAGTERSLWRQLDSLPELRVKIEKKGGKTRYSVRAAAEESLGHYADWLGIRSTAGLRSLNNLQPRASLSIGRKIRLPIKRRETISRFERKREEYHQVLAEQFKEHYDILRLDSYEVRDGDSAWSIANNHEMPLWLLIRFNAELENGRIRAGQKVILPVIEGRS
ncbi:MAG: LysM peptidoglycan-binding domain-containing protein [Pseudomonadota bacterium]|nr:LysM peptidoglycan-binding domain-containing protein [Pseudomonadota bacterium]